MPINDLLPWNRDKEKYALQKREDSSVNDFERQVNQMFADFFGEPFGMAPASNWMDLGEGFSPRMDISESDDEIRVKADLPGMDENDIHLSLEGNYLVISGEKKSEVEDKDRTYHRVERRYGSFSRSIELPAEVDPNKVEATFKKGVLTVIIPKPDEVISQRKRIPIKAG